MPNLNNEQGFIHSILVILLTVGLVGGIVAGVAANSSKPGDRLFGVDQAIERVKLAASLTNEAKARTQYEIAEERLSELQQLLSAGSETELIKIATRQYGQTISKAAQTITKVSQDKQVNHRIASLISQTTEKQLETLSQIHEQLSKETKASVEVVDAVEAAMKESENSARQSVAALKSQVSDEAQTRIEQQVQESQKQRKQFESARQETSQSTTTTRKRVCPDEWYENRQPQATEEGQEPKTSKERQYFIVDGKRVERSEMDVAWVKANCKVNKPTPVY